MTETRHSTTIDIKVDDRDVVRLGEQVERTFAAKTLDAFNKALERQSQVLASLIKQQEQLRQTLEKTHQATRGPGGGGGGGSGGGEGGKEPLGFLGTAGAVGAGTFAANMVSSLLQRLVGTGGAAMRGAFTEAAMRAVPGGGVLADTSAGAQQYYQMGVAAAESRMGAYGHTALGAGAMNRAMGWGARMGFDPLQVPGMLAETAMSTGLQGADLSRIAPLVAGAGRFGGITQAGAVVGAAGEAGGNMGGGRAEAMIRDTIGTAIEAGVRGARLDQYFQALSSFVEGMRTNGILLEPESINALVRGFAATNEQVFKGMAGIVLAQKVASGGMERAMRGRGLGASVMMQASGVMGGKNFFEAIQDVQENPAQFMPAILRRLQQSTRGVTSDATRGAMFKQVFDDLGVPMSWAQARAAGNADPDKFAEQFQLPAAERTVAAGGGYLRRGAAGAPLGVLPTERGRRIQEIGLGESRAVQDLSQHLLQLDLTIAKNFLPGMAKMVDAIVGAAESLGQADVAKVFGGKPTLGKGEKVRVPDLDRQAYDADVDQFGEEYAEQEQLNRNNQYMMSQRKNLVRQLGSEAAADRAMGYGVGFPGDAGKGGGGAAARGSAGSPVRALESLSLHLRSAADAADSLRGGADMTFTLQETEASGGH